MTFRQKSSLFQKNNAWNISYMPALILQKFLLSDKLLVGLVICFDPQENLL